MKNLFVFMTAGLMLASCCCNTEEHSLICDSSSALVQTTYGTLSGYIEDGIYTF